jgi:hypothetical protein
LRIWLTDLETVFLADRPRYSTARNRVAFASIQMDQQMKAIWAGQATKRPYLRLHWRKFLRWVEQAYLCGQADYTTNLQKFYEATQGEDEEPIIYYTRFTLLVTVVNREITADELFLRLNERLRNALTRNARKTSTVDALLQSAQEIWSTFKPKKKQKTNAEHTDNPRPRGSRTRGRYRSRYRGFRPNRGYYRGLTGPVTEEERQRRFTNNLCVQCGKEGHYAKDCPELTSNNPTTSTTDAKAQSVQQNTFRGRARGRSQARQRYLKYRFAIDTLSVLVSR